MSNDIQNIINSLNELLQQKNSIITDKHNSLVALHAHINVLEQQLAAQQNSIWWKITKPMRILTGIGRNILKAILGSRSAAASPSPAVHGEIAEAAGPAEYVYTGSDLPHKYSPVSDNEKRKQKDTQFAKNIKFSILVPLFNTSEIFLRDMINSVIHQTYSGWELCLADGSDPGYEYITDICNSYADEYAGKIIYKKLDKNRGIAGNTNQCIKMATGDYIALLDHDDALHPSALYRNMTAICQENADFIYSDECLFKNDFTDAFDPFFKPDFSPDLLYCQNYICHFLVFKKSLLADAGVYKSQFDGAQDYDLILRLTEKAKKIYHIPEVLYYWRYHSSSTTAAPDTKPYAHKAGLDAINAHLARVHKKGFAAAGDSDYTFVYDVRYNTLAHTPLISIIIPMRNKSALTNDCVDSIIKTTTYSNYEIIIINNRSDDKASIKWLKEIPKKDRRIKVFDADFEFNWSKINNFGIGKASGEVYVFLNNDTQVISPDWLERLGENSLRDDTGAVGPMLLFEDDTIQHAGIIVGMGGWADHVFKGLKPVHSISPYVSPAVNRNVSAVTGACMCVSKKTIKKIGLFDERFIICGSDVEFCLRASEAELNNIYLAYTRLYHFESKSRDSFIPEIDFCMSYNVYTPYRENGDPFYNINLDTSSTTPVIKENAGKDPNELPPGEDAGSGDSETAPVNIPELTPIIPRKSIMSESARRINLFIPSINKEHVYGGIATALEFFYKLVELSNSYSRIIVETPINMESIAAPPEYRVSENDSYEFNKHQLLFFGNRAEDTLPVSAGDIFIATAWWTAYCVSPLIKWQSTEYGISEKSLIYLIQDFEPGFYTWSARYLLSESTYKNNIKKIAIFNSKHLYDFFKAGNYHFDHSFYFDPVLNKTLQEYLYRNKTSIKKKKRVIIYGRPLTTRNAFELIIMSLKKWCSVREGIGQWDFFSLGETHVDIDLGNGKTLYSLGKVSLYEYAQIMLDTYMAVSLMVSPHPSYPPLEMAAFGIKVITNNFKNKDLSMFSKNIISLDVCNIDTICDSLDALADSYSETPRLDAPESYLTGSGKLFDDICGKIAELV